MQNLSFELIFLFNFYIYFLLFNIKFIVKGFWGFGASGRSNTKMVGMARANFPGLPAFPTSGVVKVPMQTLRSMIGRTIFARYQTKSRATHSTGGLLVLKPESITGLRRMATAWRTSRRQAKISTSAAKRRR